MNDTPAIRLPRALLEAEAAAALRCSTSTVKRLRLGGKLGYSRRRPVTIGEDDLEVYVARAKVRRVKARGKVRSTKARSKFKAFEYISAGASPKPFLLLTIAEAAIKFERTPRQIRYLCLRGRVPYIVGRPPLIDESDLADCLESKRLAALAKVPPLPGTPEFEALQKQKAEGRMLHRLRVRAVRRKVARILAEMATRPPNG